MKKLLSIIFSALMLPATLSAADGWPANYGGVMLQGFSWDSYVDTQWTNLEKQADELAAYFSLIWVPQSGNCNTTWNQMGYTPVYWYDHNSSFGTEAQLRSMINTFKAKGTGIIEDVVINHRNNLGVDGSWVDYPAEEYGGKTWQMLPTDICANDDGGKTRTWANEHGIQISSNNDTGEGWDGCRDLDHKSTNVQENVKNYLSFLLNDLGYAGFRYDMTKGYSASYTGMYNSHANPTYSVGEYWDGQVSALQNWLNGTKVNGVIQSATFDFATRYSCRDAFNNNNWAKLEGTWGLAATQDYKQYAVTFVENHDMQDRGNVTNYTKDPITKNIVAANAFILGMPGTPCVFLPHWKQYKKEIKNLIELRKMMGITNTSTANQYAKTNTYIVFKSEGTNATMLVAAGEYTYTGAVYIKAYSGTNFSYWVKSDADMAWVDVPSGDYRENNMKVTFTALSKNSSEMVYTLDGTTPTASSTKIASGASINIGAGKTVLNVGLLVDGVVKNVITREYNIEPFVAHNISVYLEDPQWGDMYFYSWANDGKNTQLFGDWPGTKQIATTEIDGKKYFYHEFNITSADYSFNIIFNQGKDKKQTIDIGPVSETTYFRITDANGDGLINDYDLINGKFAVDDITSSVADGIEELHADKKVEGIFDLQGRRLQTVPAKGMYIINGKKIIK